MYPKKYDLFLQFTRNLPKQSKYTDLIWVLVTGGVNL